MAISPNLSPIVIHYKISLIAIVTYRQQLEYLLTDATQKSAAYCNREKSQTDADVDASDKLLEEWEAAESAYGEVRELIRTARVGLDDSVFPQLHLLIGEA